MRQRHQGLRIRGLGPDLGVGALAGGLTLIALPKIIAGFVALTRALRGAALAFIGLNIAAAANPFVGLLTVATRLVAIIGGAVLGFKLFGSATAEAALKEDEMRVKTDALIASQEDLGKTVKDTANSFVDAAKVKLKSIKSEIEAVKLQIQSYQAVFRQQIQSNEALRSIYESNERFFEALNARTPSNVPDLNQSAVSQGLYQRLKDLNTEYAKQEERIQKLKDILSKPATPGGILDPDGLDRAGRALRDAGQAIDLLVQKTEAMAQGPQQFKLLTEQIKVNKKVQDFRDRLIDAGVSLELAQQKTADYAFALQQFNEMSKGTFADMQATYKAFHDSVVSGFHSLADSVSQAIVQGELSAKTFVDVFKSMVQKIIAEVLKLAVINPILNSIFGSVGGSALPSFNIGGLGFARGGAFDQGNILRNPTPFATKSGLAVAGEKGPEAIMPLVMGAKGLGIRAYDGDPSSSSSVSPVSRDSIGRMISNVYVTFQTPDASSFMQSQSQVSALLSSAVDRGQRNL